MSPRLRDSTNGQRNRILANANQVPPSCARDCSACASKIGGFLAPAVPWPPNLGEGAMLQTEQRFSA